MKWEYQILSLRDKYPAFDREQLAMAGDEGWEVVTVWGTTKHAMVLLKRPREEESKQ